MNPRLLSLSDTDDLKKWWMDVDWIVDRQMRVLDHQTLYGQAVPHHYVERSATAMAGVLGAEMELVNKDTTWATPCFKRVEPPGYAA